MTGKLDNLDKAADPSAGSGQASDLRERAEEIARARAAQSPQALEALSPEQARQALHELQVHQIELEMQNEELRRTQEELEASRARYFDLYDLAPVGYVTLSEAGLILEANLTAAKLLGVARSALVRQPLTRFILPEDQDIYYHHRQQLFATGAPQVCELRLLRADGLPFWAGLEASVGQAADGAPMCRATLSDITERIRSETERRRAGEARLESEARLTTILRQMPAGAIIADASSGQVVLANEQMDQLMHGQYQHVGSPNRYLRYQTYFPNGHAYAPKEDPLARTLSTGEIVTDEEIYFVRDDSSKAVVLVSSSPIRDREGRIIAGVMTFHDITDRKRAEEQAQQLAAIQERQRLARELHDSVSQALYGIALGARTARALLDREPREAVEPLEYVQSLAGAGLAEMRALIFELRPESLENEGLVAAITKQVDAARARHGIEVQARLCDEPDLAFSAKEALYRIAQEALNNAVKHAQATRLDVTLDCVEGKIILQVQDNGMGFDPAASYPGHLGLRSMRERVEPLSGVLELDSAPGKGTRICARIPIHKPGKGLTRQPTIIPPAL